MVAAERVLEYCDLESEADLEILEAEPDKDWPQHGEIMAENLRFSYHPSLPVVLKNIHFHIKPKEKVRELLRNNEN